MTSDITAVLRAVHSYWLDDTPRLALADMLDERQAEGDDYGDRAALLRAGVEEAKQRAGCYSASEANDRVQDEIVRTIKAIIARHTGDKATGVRWDQCRCEKCSHLLPPGRTLIEAGGGWEDCPVCGGSSDLLLRRESRNGGSVGIYDIDRPRPFRWDRGLLVVGATADEIAVEVECGKCEGSGHGEELSSSVLYDQNNPSYRGSMKSYSQCEPCKGTGRIHVPSPWLAALPWWFAVEVDGVEPRPSLQHHGTWRFFSDDTGGWLFDLIAECNTDPAIVEPQDPRWYFHSPTAAKSALVAGLGKWRIESLMAAEEAETRKRKAEEKEPVTT